MLTDKTEDFSVKIFDILPDILDDEGIFNLQQVVDIVYKNEFGSYEGDYLDIQNYVQEMKDYFVEQKMFDIISLPHQPTKMQLNEKSKKLLSFKEPKREVYFLGEIQNIAIDVFDYTNSYILNVSWNLTHCISEKYKDIKHSPTLLTNIIEFLINEGLLIEISPSETKLHNYYLTDKAKKIKKIGTYEEYNNDLKYKEESKLKLKKESNILNRLSVLVVFLGIIVQIILNLSGTESMKKEINTMESYINSLKNEINIINEQLLELNKKHIKNIDTLAIKIE